MTRGNEETYSFSKLNSWRQCKYGWYLRYIKKEDGISNAFASYGTLMHSIMERYAKGIFDLWDLKEVYEWEYETAIPEKFPKIKNANLTQSYREQGIKFLENFPGYDKYKILGVEEEFERKQSDWYLTGFIDLVFMDEQDRLIIRDYKSKASFKSKTEQKEYARQLYLYSLYVKDKYGKYPDELQFLHFRRSQTPTKIEFNQEDLEETIKWAEDTVKEIRESWVYDPNCEYFFSSHLCNFRKCCPERIVWNSRKF